MVNLKVRNSNLELYRIIVMLMIVAHHYVVNSGLMPVMSEAPQSSPSLFYYIFGMWGKTGINCFVLITGYFMCKSDITMRKFLKLLLEVTFYKIVLDSIFLLSGYQDFSLKVLKHALWPIGSVSNAFTSCYLLFFLMIPFLNILIRGMKEKQHRSLLLLTLFIYTILGSSMKIPVTMNYVSWFCVLYLIAAYVRLYDPSWLKWSERLGGVLLVLFVAIASVIVMVTVFHRDCYFFVADSNKVLAVLVSVVLFNYFRNLNIPHSKWINTIASSTYGVLLIHANSGTMREWLWKDVVDCVGHYDAPCFPLYAVGSVLAIFFLCVMIDQIRIHTVEKWFFNWYDNHFEKQ